MNYWESCIQEAFEDAGIDATKEQIETVTSWVEGAHENYGMAHGHHAITNPLKTENEQLKRDLENERQKESCSECRGTGWITLSGPIHSSTSQCYKCHGNGRI